MADQTQRDEDGKKIADEIAQLAAKIEAQAARITELTAQTSGKKTSEDDEDDRRRKLADAFFDGKNA